MAGKVVRKGMGGKNADPRIGTKSNAIPNVSRAKADHKLDTTPFAGKRIKPTTKG